ncbi:MAG TPA: CbiX/SirB N-terminal domain-containing protein [Planctomycetota bacterium]|jgi:sirohydrochlorin ferrochelatase
MRSDLVLKMSRQALLIIDHGSRRAEANASLEEVAAAIRKLRPELIVHFAHMSLAEPTIAQGFEQCAREGATEVIVHPYMLGLGQHAAADIPKLAAEAAAAHPGVSFRVTPPLGFDEKLAQLVLERAGLV